MPVNALSARRSLWMSTGMSSSCTAPRPRAGRARCAAGAARGAPACRRAHAGVEQRQPRHALGCLAQDLVGDVAAHRQAGEREALRRGGQDRLRRCPPWCRGACDRRPSCRRCRASAADLRRPQRLGAQQAGNQHEIRVSAAIVAFPLGIELAQAAGRATVPRQRAVGLQPQIAHATKPVAAASTAKCRGSYATMMHRHSLAFPGELCHLPAH